MNSSLEKILELLKGKTIKNAKIIHGDEVVFEFEEFGTPDISFAVAHPLDSKGKASLSVDCEFPSKLIIEL